MLENVVPVDETPWAVRQRGSAFEELAHVKATCRFAPICSTACSRIADAISIPAMENRCRQRSSRAFPCRIRSQKTVPLARPAAATEEIEQDSLPYAGAFPDRAADPGFLARGPECASPNHKPGTSLGFAEEPLAAAKIRRANSRSCCHCKASNSSRASPSKVQTEPSARTTWLSAGRRWHTVLISLTSHRLRASCCLTPCSGECRALIGCRCSKSRLYWYLRHPGGLSSLNWKSITATCRSSKPKSLVARKSAKERPITETTSSKLGIRRLRHAELPGRALSMRPVENQRLFHTC